MDFDCSTAFILQKYYFATISFIGVCHISSYCSMPRDLYASSPISLVSALLGVFDNLTTSPF